MLIYKVTNLVNNKLYIGQTTGTIQKRWREHKVPNSSCTNLRRAINKHGIENFKIEVLEQCVSLEHLNTRESALIKELNTLAPTGYNLTTGGDSYTCSQETRDRCSVARKGIKRNKPPWNKGLSSWCKGLSFTIEHRSAISKGHDKNKKAVKCSNGVVYESISQAADLLKLSTGKICAALNGKRKHTKGFTFERVTNNG